MRYLEVEITQEYQTHTTFQLERVYWRKLDDLSPRVIPFNTNNLSRVVKANMADWISAIGRIYWWRPKVIRRMGYEWPRRPTGTIHHENDKEEVT